MAALLLALWWAPAFGPVRGSALRVPRLTTRRIRRVLVIALLALARHRGAAALILVVIAGLAALNLPRLRPEPYPLHQLPEASTIVQAERLFNGKFAGTVPFAIELDAGEPGAFVRRAPLERLAGVHGALARSGAVGHHQSLLTVVERINSYFTDGQPSSRRLPDDPSPPPSSGWSRSTYCLSPPRPIRPPTTRSPTRTSAWRACTASSATATSRR